MPENSNPDPAAIIAALMNAATTTLGDFASGKQVARARLIIARQVESLAAIDPRFAEAFRQFVTDRVRRFVPDEEAMERVLTDPADPTHAYWIAIVPRHLLRSYCGRVCGPKPKMTLLGTLSLPPGTEIVPMGSEPEDDD